MMSRILYTDDTVTMTIALNSVFGHVYPSCDTFSKEAFRIGSELTIVCFYHEHKEYLLLAKHDGCYYYAGLPQVYVEDAYLHPERGTEPLSFPQVRQLHTAN